MGWPEGVVIGAAGIAALAAAIVPWLTYRHALQLEHRKWLREIRMNTYLSILDSLRDETEPKTIREIAVSTRALLFASDDINRALLSAAIDFLSKELPDEEQDLVEFNFQVSVTLTRIMRHELGSHNLRLTSSRKTVGLIESVRA